MSTMRRNAESPPLSLLVALGVMGVMILSSSGAFAEDPKPEKESKTTEPTAADSSDEKKDDDEEKKKEPPKDRYFAITGAVIHTVTGGDRYGATILAKNGKILEIGSDVVIPEDCEALDATGYHVYPGLVAAQSGGILGTGRPDDTTDVYSLSMTLALAGGITTVVSGNNAARLTYGSVEEMIVKRDLFKKLSYSRGDSSLRRKVRERFEKVRQYVRDLQAYEEKKKTDPDAEEPDKKWIKGEHETYLKLIRHEAVAVISADSTQEIVDVCDLAERYGISVVIRGAQEGWTAARRMAQAGVSAVISIRPPMFTLDDGTDERLNRPTGRSIENAAILYNHGVPLAIVPSTASVTTWGLAGRDLVHLNMEAAFAVRGGLPEDAALRSITIDAARILGVDHRVGSIEHGKDADFMICDGDPLHYMTLMRWTVVDGRVVYDKQKESLYSHIRPDGDRDAPPPDDYWPRRLGEDQ
jgi:imidazolonepropionase-like amidohydrolase